MGLNKSTKKYDGGVNTTYSIFNEYDVKLSRIFYNIYYLVYFKRRINFSFQLLHSYFIIHLIFYFHSVDYCIVPCVFSTLLVTNVCVP